MIKPGAVISYRDLTIEENANLQKGMNFRLKGGLSVILMSLRPGAPYSDRIEDDGKTLIYEGHDIPKRNGITNPKVIDQPYKTSIGNPTQNGLFFDAATSYKNGKSN